MRTDRPPRLEGHLLRLVDAPLLEQHLGEPTLALAQRAAVLERLQDPDRVAEEPLGRGQVATAARDLGELAQDSRLRPGRTGLFEEGGGLVERSFRLFDPAPLSGEVAA